MIFSSFRFLIFFPVVLLLYFSCRRLRYRQWVLLVASYVFYASWDPRFLSLIVFSTLVDYWVGLRLPRAVTPTRKKGWLLVSLVANLGILGFFKYANFFIGSFQGFMILAGFEVTPSVLNIVLPVGISFYTFQTMSYSLDIYRDRIEPTDHFLEFALFVAFFPQLISGPIVRAVELLPQIKRGVLNRWVDISEGASRFVQGFAKKVLVADNVAPFVDQIFRDPGQYDGLTLWMGSIGFAVQVYCDFSGYSDMAIGSARILGFRLPENFRFPFTALNVSDFWRRWHITLYSFMRDYLYISLGGSRVNPVRLAFNVVLTMTLVGFWHGANWQFLAWGFYNGLLIVGHRIILFPVRAVRGLERFLNTLGGKVLRFALTNLLFIIGLAIFRCPHLGASVHTLGRMFHLESLGERIIDGWVLFFYGLILLTNLACEADLPRRLAKKASLPFRIAAFVLLIVVLVLFGPKNTEAFVYFQF
ncbi:MAG: MBOAT family protein [Planctomycetes bacterium]|nr:MBOAT family protein [Planctomycetota bacterium]